METTPIAAAPPWATPALERAAKELEAGFLAEMLRFAAPTPDDHAFTGGVGEDQFASLLRDEHARAMVEAGGIGLAERIVRAMAVAQDG
ncbi:hypothetical protein E2L08_05275 [Palleronia sediminis]|uniref:Flagellar protein FlgJ N-terminal domain-containing protein n=1 Tax=Palleronia sediminis TaxID=2547833 RepID=A0A4R6AC31_9RHOB|nr:rod-binding protein [Palleronia sediminis]TDL81531.1 hypothetical protein E2L08_05275 [Palleronia sediminis]